MDQVVIDHGTWRIEAVGDYFRVLVQPGAIPRLGYPTWVGTIQRNGLMTPWTPAASRPRNYGRDARAILETAAAELVAAGLVRGTPRFRGGRR